MTSHTDTFNHLVSAVQRVETLAAEIRSPEWLTPALRVEYAAALTEAADQLLHAAVSDARMNKVTWQAIADQLECTRQAAHERFSH